MLNNPFEIKLETDSLKYTDYMKSIVSAKISNEEKMHLKQFPKRHHRQT